MRLEGLEHHAEVFADEDNIRSGLIFFNLQSYLVALRAGFEVDIQKLNVRRIRL